MKKKLLLTFLIVIGIINCIKMYYCLINEETIINQSLITKIGRNIQKSKYKDDKIGELYIKNIHLKENLYELNSYLNNVDRNIAVLEITNEPNKNNSLIVIAAHSGTGHIAYFKDLDKVKKNDLIILTYKNKTYNYIVNDIWNEKKTGNIKVPDNEKNQLVLTTCTPHKDNYQLIINCLLKE